MLEVFLATLNPLLTLFMCMAIGFILKKAKVVPENTAKVLSNLENWVFLPSLSFTTMAKYCRIELLGGNVVAVRLTNLITVNVGIIDELLFLHLSGYRIHILLRLECKHDGFIQIKAKHKSLW